MSDSVNKWAPIPLRMILGFGFVYHGFPKLFSAEGHEMFVGMLQNIGVPAAGLMSWFVGAVELVGGIALIAGAFASIASMLLIGNMVVAILTVHLPIGFNFMNITGMTESGPQFGMPGYETPLLYIAGLLALLLTGPSHLSVDRWLAGSRSASRPRGVTAITTVTLIALGLAPAVVEAQPIEDPTLADDEAQITELLDRYETALNSSNVDAVLGLYAPDGVFMPSSAPTAEGADQVRESYEFVFSTIQLAIRFSIDEIEVHGDLAIARTASKGSVRALADGTSVPEENRELFVFERRQGEWKIARYMFNKTS